MKLIHTLALASLLVGSTIPAAANNNDDNKRAAEQAKKAKAEKEKKKEEKKKVRDQIKEFMLERDKNKDGSLSKDEFLSAEDDKAEGESKFDEYNKNKDRSLSKSEVQDMLGL